MTTYSYLISDVNLEKLEKEIKINVNITTALSFTEFDGTNLDITFVSALSGTEKSALDIIVANHVTTGYVSISTLSVLDLRCVGTALSESGLSPNPGDFWVINGTGTSAFSGHSQQLAFWNGISWDFYAPMNGDRVLDVTNATFWIYSTTATAWIAFVRNIFGTSYNYFYSLNEQSTTQTTLQTALSGTTTSLVTGNYFIGWYFEVTATGTTAPDVVSRVSFDGNQISGRNGTGSTGSADVTYPAALFSSTAWVPISGQIKVTVSSPGTKAIKIEYARNGGLVTPTAFIRNINYSLWRTT